jgi:Ca-activated chloride channel family protein
MELNTQLNQDRFFWMNTGLGAKDRASLIVDVEAPALPTREDANPTNLVVVLDRSGSMGGGRLAHARRALCDAVDRLSSNDTFGLVTFDDKVEVNIAAGPVIDRESIKRVINGIHSRGSTDLAAGLVRGLKEARRLESLSGVRVLLISDGHANNGVTDPEVLGQLASRQIEHRITTSTLGMGLGYDEALLSAIARQGAGNEQFAEEADSAAGIIAQECGDLLSQRFLSCRLTVMTANGVTGMRVLNEATLRKIEDGVQIELGGMQPEQVRSLVLQFSPKQATRPARRKLATLRLDYTLADDLSDHSVGHTVWARIAANSDVEPKVNRDVVAEVVFQRVQRRKRDGMEALTLNDIDRAERIFKDAIRLLKKAMPNVPRNRRAEFAAEIEFIEQMRYRAIDLGTVADRSYSSKMLSMDIAGSSRNRGRRGV